MATADPNQPPTSTEVNRLLHAMQAAGMDDTLPMQLREQAVVSAYRRGQGFAIIGLASLVARRAATGIRQSGAKKMPVKELRRLLPTATPVEVRDGVVQLCLIYNQDPMGTVEGDLLVKEWLESGHGFDAFAALWHLADSMAGLVVQFDPMLRTKADLLRREALEFERQLGTT